MARRTIEWGMVIGMQYNKGQRLVCLCVYLNRSVQGQDPVCSVYLLCACVRACVRVCVLLLRTGPLTALTMKRRTKTHKDTDNFFVTVTG
jgi:hypothetical protein